MNGLNLFEEVPWQEYLSSVSQAQTPQATQSSPASAPQDSYKDIIAREIARAQASRGPAERPKKSRSGGSGVSNPAGQASLITAAEHLESPDLWAAIASQGINYGTGGVGAFNNHDDIRQALAPNTPLPAFGQGRKSGGGGFSAGIQGGNSSRLPHGTKTLNEYETRAKSAREGDFKRSEQREDFALQLQMEKQRRAQLISDLKRLLGQGFGTETSSATGEQVVNFGGLPVRVPTKSTESRSNIDSIMRLLGGM